MQFKSKCLIAGLAIHVGWVETTVETQHLSVVCWVLLSSNPTYDYHQVIDFAFLTHPTIYYFIDKQTKNNKFVDSSDRLFNINIFTPYHPFPAQLPLSDSLQLNWQHSNQFCLNLRR